MIQITKADGTREPYKPQKLRQSLTRAGASKEEVNDILKRIEKDLYDSIKTQEIYSKAFAYLREMETTSAARYSLRRALFNLGPTGFPFEDFLARLYQTQGYTVKKRVVLRGNCAAYELDVVGYKDDHAFIAEAKFHAHPGIKSDLQVALYSYARFLDLENVQICKDDRCGIRDGVVITNTKFTSAAVRYAECVGLQLLSWNYPRKGNLHDLVQASGLYPITVITSLSTAQKRSLIERNIVVCSDIVARPQVLRHLHLSKRKAEAVLSEARQLCH